MRANPVDLGPQIDPKTVEVGKQYYVSMYDRPVTKVIVLDKSEDPPELRLDLEAVGGSEYVGTYPRLPTFPLKRPWKKYDTKIYEVLDFSRNIMAQTNVLRNLGRYGKVPMNIAMHKLPGYLGLGGSKTKRRKRRTHKTRRVK